MVFQREEFNKTEQIPEKGFAKGLIFLKNKYQTLIDNDDVAIANMVHYLEEQKHELSDARTTAEGLKQDVGAHEKERENAYEALGNLLNKETDFEKAMHKETTGMYKEVSKNQASKSIKIKQRMNDSDNEMRFASMMKYLEKYPEYQTRSSFKKILDKIEEKEREIRQAKKEYHKAVSDNNAKISRFKEWIQKAKDKIAIYERDLKEGETKIQSHWYYKTFLKISSTKTKETLILDTSKHRGKMQFENTLKIIEEGLSEYKGRKFLELDY